MKKIREVTVKMNYCEYELLSIVYDFECIDYPDLIPCPRKLRRDPEFSDALDFLLDNGYMEVRGSRFSVRDDGVGSVTADRDDEILTITATGIKALKTEEIARMDFWRN